MTHTVDLHPLGVDFEKWVALFSKFEIGEPTTIDTTMVNQEEFNEIRSAIGLVRTLMGYEFDWGFTARKQWTIRRTR